MRSVAVNVVLTIALAAVAASAGPASAAPAGHRAPTGAPVRTVASAEEAAAAFHAERAGRTVWDDDAFAALLRALAGLHEEGLDPRDYRLAELEGIAADRLLRDRLATTAWFDAAEAMVYGRLDAKRLEPGWTAVWREGDLAATLAAALAAGSVDASLAALAPDHRGYRVLRDELARLRAGARAPQVTVPEGDTLREGASGARVDLLQARLRQLGLLADGEALPGAYDAATRAAVEAFQFDAGLDVDGVVGAATLRTLNRSVAARIDALVANLERWRWLPGDLGGRHVRVNIAGFDVTTWADGAAVRTYLAIVGRTYRRTPIFSDQIRYLIFNPWWETPASIARRDKLPLFQRDPAAVERLGFEVLDPAGGRVDPTTIDWAALDRSHFPYRIRQAPGPENALGRVKIMFPNEYNVYMHDTPQRGLFAQRQRAFSSGCIRVQDPLALAAWLLEETAGWDRERIDAVVASGAERRVDLAAQVPVHVLYFTAVAEEDDQVRYLDDLYERDAPLLQGLASRANP